MKWISVNEKLPENGIEVLIFCESSGLCFYRLAYRPLNALEMSVWKTDRGMLLNEVTHWMDLPKSPYENKKLIPAYDIPKNKE